MVQITFFFAASLVDFVFPMQIMWRLPGECCLSKLDIFMLAHSLLNEHDEGSEFLGIVTWSVLGKQNRQAKNVYCQTCSKIHICTFFRSLLSIELSYFTFLCLTFDDTNNLKANFQVRAITYSVTRLKVSLSVIDTQQERQNKGSWTLKRVKLLEARDRKEIWLDSWNFKPTIK